MKLQDDNRLKYNQQRQKRIVFGEMTYQRIVEWLFWLGTIAIVVKSLISWLAMQGIFFSNPEISFMEYVLSSYSPFLLFLFLVFSTIFILFSWYIICQVIYLILKAIDVWRMKNERKLQKMLNNDNKNV